jgi:hypothetical protein
MSIIQHYIKLHSILKYPNRFTSFSDFQGVVNLIQKNHIKSEIIGQWIYSFTTDLIGVQLLALGFWYSFKHYAYVYSGNPKDGIPDDETLDEIRARLGSKQIRN